MRNTIAFPVRRDGRPLCIAHRGASAWAVENTLAAFRTAAELGADMWEIDVQLSCDGVPVVSHDAGLSRIFEGEGVIAELTLAEIRERAPDLPTLEEVIDLATELDQALYVEIKARGAGRIAAAMLQAKGFTRAGLGSFDMAEVRDLADDGCPYPLAVLVRLGADPFDCAEQAGADIIHLCWERGGERPQDLVTRALVAEAEHRGLGIVLWHEERRPIMRDLLAMPVLGICTNQPELMAGTDSVDLGGIEIVCHRGANRFAPENTLAAARLSLEQGCHYVEVDVRETADGELVIIHDATLERTTNGSGTVANKTLAELRDLDAGSWFSPVYRGERIPTLTEMIALCQSYGAKMYIENKCADPQRIVALVEDMGFAGDCFHWSGDPALQAAMRAASSSARIKSSLGAYPDLTALQAHLSPAIVEMRYPAYVEHADEAKRLGMVPMLQYFGDDPAVFDLIVTMRPPMINLDRADLLLSALRRAEGGRAA